MKFLRCLRKVIRTFNCVQEHLPDVLKELEELKGVTFIFINELKNIWFD